MEKHHDKTPWYKVALYSLLSGTTYGITSIVVGHPMDTVKTKMQSQT